MAKPKNYNCEECGERVWAYALPNEIIEEQLCCKCWGKKHGLNQSEPIGKQEEVQ